MINDLCPVCKKGPALLCWPNHKATYWKMRAERLETLVQHLVKGGSATWNSERGEYEVQEERTANPTCPVCGSTMECDIVSIRLNDDPDPWFCPHFSSHKPTSAEGT